MASSHAVLLLNLGSPKSTETKDVRNYLREFLMDERVIDKPYWLRKLIVEAFILPTRPKQSAEAYKEIWTEEGSPLITMSYKLQELVSKGVDVPVALAMRYGEPSIQKTIEDLKAQGVKHLYVMPLYPHYAMSSYETVVVRVQEVIKQVAPEMETNLLQPFYQDPEYIDALVESARPYLEKDFDKLLFSFHGIPERHLRKSDPSKAHCLSDKSCCQNPNPAHATCYRHHCFKTVEAFVKKAGLKPEQYTVSFQSRLGRDPWLTPYTDKVFEELPELGVKKLLVICPAFVSDCLETLEEIQMQGEETFLDHGGSQFQQIPCLNDHPLWVQFLQRKIQRWLQAPQPVKIQKPIMKKPLTV